MMDRLNELLKIPERVLVLERVRRALREDKLPSDDDLSALFDLIDERLEERDRRIGGSA